MRVAAMVLLALFPLSLSAQDIHYGDVSPDLWFADEVQAFLAGEYLDVSQPRFRAADPATRAEFMKLVVELNGGILDELPEKPGFHDVSADDWFFGYLEESAREGWTRGDGDCYGNALPVEPCNVRPHAPIVRAEAAALVRRAFGKVRLHVAPAFDDNPAGTWYFDAVQAAADHCVLRGDDASGLVRPGNVLNRAEMVVMLWRVDHGGRYPECS